MIAPRSLLALLLGALVVFGAGCSSSAEPLDAEAARLLDVANNVVADLTEGPAEEVPLDALRQAALRAKSAGTTLRIVVADAEGEFVSAKSVVDRYGGTAITYQADRTGFEGASRDMSGDQLDRAIDAARVELDIGDSATAFVDVLETEGLQKPGRSFARTVLLLLLIPAAAFMLSGAWSYAQARSRRIRRERAFAERKAVLRDWADQLQPQVDAVAPALNRADDVARQSFREAEEFAATIGPKLDEATSLGELDAAEMRIGRAAIKLRDLRRSLNA